jgi:membrane dipeptidase
MPLSRRQLIGSSLLAPLALSASTLTDARRSTLAPSIASTLIDGLGFPGGRSLDEDALLIPRELQDIRESALVASHLTVGPVGSMPPLAAFEKTVRSIMRWEQEIDSYGDTLSRIRNAPDIDAAGKAGTTGLIYGLQDGVLFEDDLERLTALARMGVRIIQPTYNRRNLLGDGCMETANAGLSRTGVAAIERMNDLNILIDLSHCGRRTTANAIAASSQPVSFTHTGCHALAEHPRHRTDSEIRAVSDSGGVTGIFIMPYLAKGAQPTAADVIHHIEHAVKTGGEDHVAIGTDGSISPTEVSPEFVENFRDITQRRAELGIAAPYETETGYLFASDLNGPDRFVTLAGLLLDRGHSDTAVAKIMGGNLRRLFGEVW